MKNKKISVVFSFYNEEDVLDELIKRTSATLEKTIKQREIDDYEIIFVNDASTDSSLKILKKYRAYNDRIKIINMSRNFGVAPCVLAGFAYSSGDAIIYLDADLQDPPELFPKLIKQWQDGAQVVHTRRTKRHGETWIKLQITKVGYFLLNKLTHINLPIQVGDFKLLSRRVVDEVLKFKENNPFTRGLIACAGFKQDFVEYDRDPRHSGETKFKVFSKSVISNFLHSAFISYSLAPLYVSLFLGIFITFISFCALVYALVLRFVVDTTPGWTAIISLITTIGGVQLMCLGVIGLYVGETFMQTKNRPQYIVESEIGFKNTSSNK